MNTLRWNTTRVLQLMCALLFALQLNLAWAQQATSTAVDTKANPDAIPELAQAPAVIAPDRFEKMNRSIFKFNQKADKYVLGPVAKGYARVTPDVLKNCVGNFFENLTVPYTALNNILQGKFKSAGQDLCRFVINSTVGFGGCIDVASQWKVPKHKEDFGQTLAVWGVKSGPFVMLPFYGPSTLRDTLAKPVDYMGDPVTYVGPVRLAYSVRALRIIDTRVQLSNTLDLTNEMALDPYTFVRDGWLQAREAEIKDENSFDDFAPADAVPATDATPAADHTSETNANAAAASHTGVVDKNTPPVDSSNKPVKIEPKDR